MDRRPGACRVAHGPDDHHVRRRGGRLDEDYLPTRPSTRDPLERRDGRPLRIGHRGAAALAPENTLRAFRAAVEAGVDLVEFDVLDLGGHELVVAHSYDLREVSHGALTGTIQGRTLEGVRADCPELPSLDEALAFFVEEAPDVGIHLDVKSETAVPRIAHALRELGLVERSLATSFEHRALRRLAELEPGVRTGISFPADRAGVHGRHGTARIVRGALRAFRAVTPRLVPGCSRELERRRSSCTTRWRRRRRSEPRTRSVPLSSRGRYAIHATSPGSTTRAWTPLSSTIRRSSSLHCKREQARPRSRRVRAPRRCPGGLRGLARGRLGVRLADDHDHDAASDGASAPAPPPVPAPIAFGVMVGGVPVEGMLPSEATEAVRKAYVRPIPLVVSPTRRIRLAPSELRPARTSRRPSAAHAWPAPAGSSRSTSRSRRPASGATSTGSPASSTVRPSMRRSASWECGRGRPTRARDGT